MKRTSEREMALQIVRLLRQTPAHRATVAEIIHLLPRWATLTRGDLQMSPSRPGERRFHQVVRNIGAHDSGSKYGLYYHGGGVFRLNQRPAKHVAVTLAAIAQASRQARRVVQ